MAGKTALAGASKGRGCELTFATASSARRCTMLYSFVKTWEAEIMKATSMLRYLDEQETAIQALINQLDEVQVAFNAQYDQFLARHDATLERLTDQLVGSLDAVSPDLQTAVKERLPEERKYIDDRRQKVRDEFLPRRQEAADTLLKDAQAELVELRTLNPQLDRQEEDLKRERAELEAQLSNLNETIGQKARGLGVVRHFVSITRDDRERQRIIGKLEMINNSLHQVRMEWEKKQTESRNSQTKLQQEWQLESIAVARLQSELDQLDDEVRRENLALRRSIRQVLDALKKPASSANPELEAELQDMVALNIQTDAYHEGLAVVGGFIGLLRGIESGMQAIHKSIDGLDREQKMHSAYLTPLDFSLPGSVESFHNQWSVLAQRFSDEAAISAHPSDFAANVKPLLEGPLSQVSIEAMFTDLGEMVERATTSW